MPDNIFVYQGIDYRNLAVYDIDDLLKAKSMLSYEALYSDLASEMYGMLQREIDRRVGK